MLIGTKCDVDEREVPLEKGRRLAREMGVYFQEVSAKKGKNTERVLSDLKRLLFWRRSCPRYRTPLNAHLLVVEYRWTSILTNMTKLGWDASSALLTSKSTSEKASAGPLNWRTTASRVWWIERAH